MSDLAVVRYVELVHGVRIEGETAQRMNDNVRNLLAMVAPSLVQSAVSLDGFHAPMDERLC